MGLTPKQKYTRIALEAVLEKYRGAVLRGDMGVGKTWIACDIASKYKNVLFVGKASSLADLRDKMSQYERDTGNLLNITAISYQGYANPKKMSTTQLSKYDLFIWDESHLLRNYSASYTTRYCRGTKGKHLHLSGTPLLNSPKDFLYVLRKCGLFESTDWFYKQYFNSHKSRTGYWVHGEFRNEDCYQNHVDRVCVELHKKDVQSDMPDILFNVVDLPGKYSPPEDITKETKTRIEAGLTKVKGAAKHISKTLRETGATRGLILCYFHEVAKKVSEELGAPVATTKEQVRKEFKRMAKDGGFLVTTLGLTSSSLDLNECDYVFMVESTYSYPLDMQSVERCQRLGKKNDVHVYYYVLGGETSIAKSFSRQYLLDNRGRSKLSPSQLARLEKCPGSYWLPALDERPEYVEKAVAEGTKLHEVVERYLTSSKESLPTSLPEITRLMITSCRKLKNSSKYSGVESKVNLFTVHPKFQGTVDFWAFFNDTLYVVDYKSGSAAVSVENNLQLIGYSLMILHTYRLKPKRIHHIILQRDKKKACFYEESVLQSWERRVQRIIDKIKEAEHEPIKYINQDSRCDFFCPAREYHQKGNEMTQQFTAADRIYPRATVTGKVTYAARKEYKKGSNVYKVFNLGLGIEKLTDELKNAFEKGSDNQKLLQASIEHNEQYDNYSFFLSGFAGGFEGPTTINQGDTVTVSFKIKPPKADSKFQKINFQIVKITLKETKEEWSEESQADDGELQKGSWG